MQRHMTQFLPQARGRTLRHHFILYGLLIALPMLMFGAWTVHNFSKAERETTEQYALWRVRDLSNNIAHDLERVADQLNTLSTSRNLAAGKYEDVYVRAAHAAGIFKASIIVRDPRGQQVVNTHVPWGTALPGTNPSCDSLLLAYPRRHGSTVAPHRGNVASRRATCHPWQD